MKQQTKKLTEEEKKNRARERAKNYYQKNKEKILARQKEYFKKRYHSDEEFRKRTLENHKRYEKNNLEKVRKIKNDSQKKYYQKNKEYYHNYSKKWGKDFQLKAKKLEETINKIEAIVYSDLSNLDVRISIQEELDKLSKSIEGEKNEC